MRASAPFVLGEDVADGIALVAPDKAVDGAVEGRGEQQGLAVVGRAVEELLHDWKEAHVGHAVGFVDDDDLHLVEHDFVALDQVAEAAGAGDEDVDTLPERLDLEAVARAAEHGRDPQLADAAEPLQLAGHLGGELAGRHEDERPRPPGDGPLRRGRRSGCRRPGSCRSRWGPGRSVAAGEAVRDGERLDREGRVNAAGLQVETSWAGTAERVERG